MTWMPAEGLEQDGAFFKVLALVKITRFTEADLYIKANNRNSSNLTLQNLQPIFKGCRPQYMDHHDLILANSCCTHRYKPHTNFKS